MPKLSNADRPAPGAPHLCPGCYGWGFPIMFFNGRETYNTSVRCPDCGGTGLRADMATKDSPQP